MHIKFSEIDKIGSLFNVNLPEVDVYVMDSIVSLLNSHYFVPVLWHPAPAYDVIVLGFEAL